MQDRRFVKNSFPVSNDPETKSYISEKLLSTGGFRGIGEHADQLDKELDLMRETIRTLEDRLNPILANVATEQYGLASSDDPDRSAMFNQIVGQVEDLKNFNAWLLRIIERVEL